MVQGENVDLPCRLVDSQEELSQVTWQKKTREYPDNHNFYIISPKEGPQIVNGGGDRYLFIGNIADNNGTMQLRDARLLDEGTYTCIFTVFPSGPHKTEISLTVLVPPVMSVTVEATPIVMKKEVTLAICVAANAKPAAEVEWDTEALGVPVRTITNSTQHANDTTTVISHLLGVPTRDANQQLVQCVVKQSALKTEKTLPYKLDIHYPPMSVNISEVSSQSLVLVLKCHADGNPYPRYNWKRLGKPWPDSAETKGGTLNLILTSGVTGLYVCEASNQYGSTTASLYVHQDTGSCSACWALFGVILFINIIAASAAALVWYWRKHRRLPCLNMAAQDRLPVPTETVSEEVRRRREEAPVSSQSLNMEVEEEQQI